ncbi:MAG: hypothetical protein WKG07_47600 [Hymenobacter sp.]
MKKLEEMGIGRPSTYAPTISAVQKRGYVEKDSREGKERKIYAPGAGRADGDDRAAQPKPTAPTKPSFSRPIRLWWSTTSWWSTSPIIVDFQFTAKVEDEFDQIANGREDWGAHAGRLLRASSTPRVERRAGH